MPEQNNAINSLAHTKWNCKYHIAFAPKYRTQIAITSWTPRGKNLGHGWSRRIYP